MSSQLLLATNQNNAFETRVKKTAVIIILWYKNAKFLYREVCFGLSFMVNNCCLEIYNFKKKYHWYRKTIAGEWLQ